MSRSRTKSYGPIQGRAGWNYSGPNFVWVDRDGYIGKSTCVDSGVRGSKDGHLEVTHLSTENPTWSKPQVVPPTNKVYENFPLSYFSLPADFAHLADPSRPSNPELAVSVLSRTNPSRPKVDLPVSYVELRELPSLVRRTGSNYLKRVASENLKFQFGWVPIISDFKKLMNFQKDVSNRIELLNKFATDGTMLRKVKLYKSIVEQNDGSTIVTNSSPGWGKCSHIRVSQTTTRDVWGYVRWTPDASFDSIRGNPDALQRAAINAVYGLKIDHVTAWNLLPWSWLADWYSNLGDWLSAHRQIVPISPGSPVICETLRSTRAYTNLASTTLGMAAGVHNPKQHVVSKTRNGASATFPSASLPLLTLRQTGILSSLFVLRTKNGRN